MLEALRYGDRSLWPKLRHTIFVLLRQTKFWGCIRQSSAVLKLLKGAVISDDVELVKLLLENNVSVQKRIDGMSALETACLRRTGSSEARDIFSLLLDYADTSCLDKINPCTGQGKGLIHYLAGFGKQQQLEELLKRGVDVDLRTNFHVEAQPAVVQHVWEGSPESAVTLLEHGADPTAADLYGMDTALAAAFRGNKAVLLRLHIGQGEGWQLNWKQTCNVLFTGARGTDLVISGANALHLAAGRGHCDVLRFYIDKGLLTDLDTRSVELLTPMHVAAFSGKIGAIRFLHSRGGDLSPKSADGSLPLHLAMRMGHTDAVRFIANNGSATYTDLHGNNPVEYVMQLQQ